MHRADFDAIVAMRAIKDHPRRGYAFEQAAREILPWAYRPPLAVVAQSEQLDAFFEWNSWHFLVEAKAKTGAIRRGSPDWEDFELKLRKRHGQCIGLFMSLFDVSQGVEDAAVELNRQGMTTLILAGTFWDDAASVGLPMEDVLHYLVANARSRGRAVPPPLLEVRQYAVDRDRAADGVADACQRASAAFLRRHKLDRHSDLYVRREVDRSIKGMAQALKPSALERTRRESRHQGLTYTTSRTVPSQICVLRDASGAGKTTMSVQLALTRSPFFGIARAAVEPEIDTLPDILAGITKGFGLEKLRMLNAPIIYAIDSLDEAGHVPHKATEVNGLLRALDSLNELARKDGLLCFPVGLVFTVREEYWERWNAHFEGRNTTMLRQRISTFGHTELEDAIERYTKVYDYRLLRPPSPASRRVLSVPVNLLVYSEAHKFEGAIDCRTAFDNDVLALYFGRKQEDVLKRYVVGFNAASLMRVSSRVAMMMAESDTDRMSWSAVATEIESSVPHLTAESDEIVRILVSEQILARDGSDEQLLRFRHARFVEYLVAHHIATSLRSGELPAQMADQMAHVHRASLLSPYRVFDMLKHICASQYPDKLAAVTEFFSGSSAYMGLTLSRLRSDAARGIPPQGGDLELVSQSTTALDPQITWDAFFVLAAKPSEQAADVVLEAFKRAWTACEGRVDRWKLLQKVADLGLLSETGPIDAVIESSDDPREWEVLLGSILGSGDGRVFRKRWRKTGGLVLPIGDDWVQVGRLLEAALGGAAWIPGSTPGDR